ncbi:MAG TPA: carboxypeptidase-like regulatory domain-containing protein, partial [Candidatus Eremiobacteraceae bacterium]|nr:carboxypeptidase-like regulatory domain-containing protein [Candidatus Eremiobacteraceae bacterium]
MVLALALVVFNTVFSRVTSGQSTFGAIVGVVRDPRQGAVADAQLKLVNLDDRSERNGTTDTNGGFEFLNLDR